MAGQFNETENTLKYLEFAARRNGLTLCVIKLEALGVAKMGELKSVAVRQGDILPPEQFTAWLGQVHSAWLQNVCATNKTCESNPDKNHCQLWTQIIAPYFIELAEIRGRSREEEAKKNKKLEATS